VKSYVPHTRQKAGRTMLLLIGLVAGMAFGAGIVMVVESPEAFHGYAEIAVGFVALSLLLLLR